MAYSIVQHVTNDGTGTNVSVSCAATTAGNLLVAMIGITRNSPLGTDSFTALPSGWVQIGSTIDDLSWSEVTGGLFYLPNCSAGLTSFAWTIGVAPNHWDIMFLEISGVATASPLDVSNVKNAQVVHTSDTVSATTTANGDLILGLGIWDDLDVNPTAFNDGTGYTLIQSFSDASGWETLRAVWQTQTSAGAISYSPSWTGSADDILWIAAFKAAGGTAMPLVTQAEAKFYVRANLQTQARSKFLIRLKLATIARAKFVIRLALKTQARSKFLVNQIINPLKQFKISFLSKNKYNVKFSEAAMVLPNSTTQSSATVTDASGNLQASLTGTVTVYYPGYPNTANSGPLAPVNVGGGVYTLTYTTLGPGLYKELWSFSDGSGNVLTDYNTIPCDY